MPPGSSTGSWRFRKKISRVIGGSRAWARLSGHIDNVHGRCCQTNGSGWVAGKQSTTAAGSRINEYRA
jgi:hypothetical protein